MFRLEDIVIDDEFRDLMPAYDDAGRLEAEIELRGWSDEPITVWKNHGILLDGHRRHAIWQKRDDDGPQVRELSFASREAAMHWMVNFAFARRNLSDAERKYLLGKKYKAEKNVRGAPEGNQNAKKQCSGNQNIVSARPDGSVRTIDIVAKGAGVSHDTVHKSEQYANAVDDLDKRGVVKKADILSGAVKVPASKVVAASKAASPEEAKAVLTAKPPRKEKEAAPTSTAEATDKQHEAAVSAAADACNSIQHSKLLRLSKNNPSRDYAFDEVIKWLKAQKKAK